MLHHSIIACHLLQDISLNCLFFFFFCSLHQNHTLVDALIITHTCISNIIFFWHFIGNLFNTILHLYGKATSCRPLKCVHKFYFLIFLSSLFFSDNYTRKTYFSCCTNFFSLHFDIYSCGTPANLLICSHLAKCNCKHIVFCPNLVHVDGFKIILHASNIKLKNKITYVVVVVNAAVAG